jgi:hypothetical protein
MLCPHDSPFESACSIWFKPPEERTARELQQLSKAERERVWADLSGDPSVSKYEIKRDDPMLVSCALEHLIQELPKIPNTTALGVAFQVSSDYVANHLFLLKFLRAKHFDAAAALKLLSRHFEMKKDLFGENKLGRDVLLSDLNEDDLESLRCGAFQFLSKPDIAGRAVSFSRPLMMKFKNRINMVWSYLIIVVFSVERHTIGS